MNPRKLVVRPSALLVLLAASPLEGQTVGALTSQEEYSSTQGGFVGPLHDGDEFGRALASLPYYLTDQQEAIGAPGDDDGGVDRGAVWMLRFGGPGLTAETKMSSASGRLPALADGDRFGSSIAALQIFPSMWVGAPGDDGGGLDRGALWWLELNPNDLSISAALEIADLSGGFTGTLEDSDGFGAAVAVAGDLDGDGNLELAVGAPGDDGGGSERGAVWLLSLDYFTFRVTAQVEISSIQGGFGGVLDDGDRFGSSVLEVGDLDGDGVEDLAVGAPGDDDGGTDRGAVWVLFLNTDGTVRSHVKYSSTQGGFGGALHDGDAFGSALAYLHDLDLDGNQDLGVGAPGDDDGGMDRGAVWLLLLHPDLEVVSEIKISSTAGSFAVPLQDHDGFGSAIAGNLWHESFFGEFDLATGSPGVDDGGPGRGALWGFGLTRRHYGCGINPLGSLDIIHPPRIGSGFWLGVDNPLGTQSPGAIPFLVLSMAPDPSFPCGTQLGGFGMGPGGIGELLVSLDGGDLLRPIRYGSPWEGAGKPTRFGVFVPMDPGLVGLTIFAQGLLVEPPPTSVRFGLTDAIELTILP